MADRVKYSPDQFPEMLAAKVECRGRLYPSLLEQSQNPRNSRYGGRPIILPIDEYRLQTAYEFDGPHGACNVDQLHAHYNQVDYHIDDCSLVENYEGGDHPGRA
jgi:hypothetical protein